MLIDDAVFQYLFSFPGALIEGFVIGTVIGGGSMGLYLAHRSKEVVQRALGERAPRHVARSMTVPLRLNSISLTMGVLAFFGLLAGNVSVTGMVLTSWAVVFVATCGLVALSVCITSFMAGKRRANAVRKALGLEGTVMDGKPQRVRSRQRTRPKEAREEEQGPTPM